MKTLKGIFVFFAMVECLYKKLRIRIYFRANATKATSNKFSRNNSVTTEQKNVMQVNTTFTIIYIYMSWSSSLKTKISQDVKWHMFKDSTFCLLTKSINPAFTENKATYVLGNYDELHKCRCICTNQFTWKRS